MAPKKKAAKKAASPKPKAAPKGSAADLTRAITDALRKAGVKLGGRGPSIITKTAEAWLKKR